MSGQGYCAVRDVTPERPVTSSRRTGPERRPSRPLVPVHPDGRHKGGSKPAATLERPCVCFSKLHTQSYVYSGSRKHKHAFVPGSKVKCKAAFTPKAAGRRAAIQSQRQARQAPGTRLYVDFVWRRVHTESGGAARLHTKSTYRRVPGAWNASIR